jgi:hypothetical protein
MTMPSMIRSRLWLQLSLFAFAAACASSAREVERLPFHLAVAVPVAEGGAGAAATAPEGVADVTLALDAAALHDKLVASLGGTFARVTKLAGKVADDEDATLTWAAMAKRAGADIVLIPRVAYSPQLTTSLNDRFWLNLPLFAIGGPFGWFVSDRSYFCDTRLEGAVHDVSLAMNEGIAARESASLLMGRQREVVVQEAALNFLDRADGVTPYLLSLVVPAGFIAPESSDVPAVVADDVIDRLSQQLARDLRDERTALVKGGGVDFHPSAYAVIDEGGKPALRIEVSLESTNSGGLDPQVAYALAGGATGTVELRAVETAKSSKRRKVFACDVPLPAGYRGSVQWKIQQRDRFATARSFTYAVGSAAN